jgi:Flp pilus assembly protein TadG
VFAKRSFRRDERGAAAVEMALAAPILFAAIFGLFHVGYALHLGANLQWELERACRRILLAPNTSEWQIRDHLAEKLGGQLQANRLSVAMQRDETDATAKVARVTASYSHTVPMLFIEDLEFDLGSRTVVPLP